jgi:hypothetical protein
MLLSEEFFKVIELYQKEPDQFFARKTYAASDCLHNCDIRAAMVTDQTSELESASRSEPHDHTEVSRNVATTSQRLLVRLAEFGNSIGSLTVHVRRSDFYTLIMLGFALHESVPQCLNVSHS